MRTRGSDSRLISLSCRTRNLHANPPLLIQFTVNTNLNDPTTMTEQEIVKLISNVEGLGGMTVNERLFVCGLMSNLTKY